jgi:hypothetical protein
VASPYQSPGSAGGVPYTDLTTTLSSMILRDGTLAYPFLANQRKAMVSRHGQKGNGKARVSCLDGKSLTHGSREKGTLKHEANAIPRIICRRRPLPVVHRLLACPSAIPTIMTYSDRMRVLSELRPMNAPAINNIRGADTFIPADFFRPIRQRRLPVPGLPAWLWWGIRWRYSSPGGRSIRS